MSPLLDTLHRFSSFNRLRRVTAYVSRFIFNCQQSKSTRRTRFMTTKELTEATYHWIRITQELSFNAEKAACTTERSVSANSPLKSLNPFLDAHGLLRVGGRSNNVNISYDTRHPIILPKKCHLNELLIAHTHINNMHSGPQLTSAALRQYY